MGSKLKICGGALAFAVLVGSALGPATSQVPGAPAQVVAYEPPTATATFKVTDLGRSASTRDDHTSKARFRVVKRTGNCCENYLTSSSRGRLFDIGGSYINFTDDLGASWESVRPPGSLVNGEGTMAAGPGGDILAVEWDPYSGDHLISYKYDAQGESWIYLEAPLHTPFYDRPWLSVVPGPFTIQTGEVPYVTFVDGFPHTGQMLYSTDGVAYLPASSPFIDDELEEPIESWIPTKKSPELDWIQPNTNSPIIPLGGGRALTPPDSFGNTWSILNPETLRWAPFTLPGGEELRGRFLVDGKGRIHNLVTTPEGFDYRISTNGGRSWTSTPIVLPPGTSNVGGYLYDFRANAKVGVAAVSLHGRRGDSDLDLLYKLDITADKARLTHLYEIGKGDVDASNSGPPAQIRFDFATVTILPNGKLAVSFLDSTTDGAMHLAELAVDRLGPALAIEL